MSVTIVEVEAEEDNPRRSSSPHPLVNEGVPTAALPCWVDDAPPEAAALVIAKETTTVTREQRFQTLVAEFHHAAPRGAVFSEDATPWTDLKLGVLSALRGIVLRSLGLMILPSIVIFSLNYAVPCPLQRSGLSRSQRLSQQLYWAAVGLGQPVIYAGMPWYLGFRVSRRYYPLLALSILQAVALATWGRIVLIPCDVLTMGLLLLHCVLGLRQLPAFTGATPQLLPKWRVIPSILDTFLCGIVYQHGMFPLYTRWPDHRVLINIASALLIGGWRWWVTRCLQRIQGIDPTRAYSGGMMAVGLHVVLFRCLQASTPSVWEELATCAVFSLSEVFGTIIRAKVAHRSGQKVTPRASRYFADLFHMENYYETVAIVVAQVGNAVVRWRLGRATSRELLARALMVGFVQLCLEYICEGLTWVWLKRNTRYPLNASSLGNHHHRVVPLCLIGGAYFYPAILKTLVHLHSSTLEEYCHAA